MRWILFTILLLNFNSAICQNTEPGPSDYIDFKRVLIKNQLNKSYAFGSYKELQKAFGKAIKITKERSDILGGFDYTYHYRGLQATFNGGEWLSTIIKGKEYTASIKDEYYKVGEHISALKNRFPISYAHKERLSKNDNVLGIMGDKVECYVLFKYNDKGIITQIIVAYDNS